MLRLNDIRKEYSSGGGSVLALRGVSIEFRASELVAVLGPSGCGKTTLLNIIGGLDRATSGSMTVDGTTTAEFGDREWDAYRNHSVGFVFQGYNLIPHLDAVANVEMALKISGRSKEERRRLAEDALESVGLKDQAHKKPAQMSGGQMQRVAIARALVNDPAIILADEPTGALDSETSLQVMEILAKVARERLVIMVTHNAELAERYATRIIRMKDGAVRGDSNPPTSRELDEPEQGAAFGRARLGFSTALSLSAKNLMTKKGRTLLTAFAGAIGIIGIALILAISSGMSDYISSVERDTMGSYPIELEAETIDMSGAGMMGSGGGLLGVSDSEEEGEDKQDGIYSNNVVASAVEAEQSTVVENNLALFKGYLEENEDEVEGSLAAVEYGYNVEPLVLRTDGENDEIVTVSPSELDTGDDGDSAAASATGMGAPGGTAGMAGGMGGSGRTSGGMSMGAMGGSGSSVSSSWQQLPADSGLIEQNYELVAGTMPEGANEAALIVDGDNQVSDYTLYTLGLLNLDDMDALVDAVENGEEYEDEVAFFDYGEALGLSFKVLATSDLYVQDENGVWVDASGDVDAVAAAYDAAPDVTITAVLRAGDEATIQSGVAYTAELTTELMDRAASSDVVQQQLADPSVNVLTGLPFDDAGETSETSASANMTSGTAMSTSTSLSSTVSDTYEDVLSTLGYATTDDPASISLYPADFDGKAHIEDFIVSYNDQAAEGETVTYTDMVSLMTSSISSIVDIISAILIAFVAVSLVVSSIMIAIITYISVLERTKEIGILRAIGASKGDVSKIFNAETVIEGLLSGIAGVLIALVICIPINSVIESMFGVSGLASLPAQYGVMLVAISVVLTFLAGYIPSRIAAKKDPVVALRTE